MNSETTKRSSRQKSKSVYNNNSELALSIPPNTTIGSTPIRSVSFAPKVFRHTYESQDELSMSSISSSQSSKRSRSSRKKHTTQNKKSKLSVTSECSKETDIVQEVQNLEKLSLSHRPESNFNISCTNELHSHIYIHYESLKTKISILDWCNNQNIPRKFPKNNLITFNENPTSEQLNQKAPLFQVQHSKDFYITHEKEDDFCMSLLEFMESELNSRFFWQMQFSENDESNYISDRTVFAKTCSMESGSLSDLLDKEEPMIKTAQSKGKASLALLKRMSDIRVFSLTQIYKDKEKISLLEYMSSFENKVYGYCNCNKQVSHFCKKYCLTDSYKPSMKEDLKAQTEYWIRLNKDMCCDIMENAFGDKATPQLHRQLKKDIYNSLISNNNKIMDIESIKNSITKTVDILKQNNKKKGKKFTKQQTNNLDTQKMTMIVYNLQRMVKLDIVIRKVTGKNMNEKKPLWFSFVEREKTDYRKHAILYHNYLYRTDENNYVSLDKALLSKDCVASYLLKNKDKKNNEEKYEIETQEDLENFTKEMLDLSLKANKKSQRTKNKSRRTKNKLTQEEINEEMFDDLKNGDTATECSNSTFVYGNSDEDVNQQNDEALNQPFDINLNDSINIGELVPRKKNDGDANDVEWLPSTNNSDDDDEEDIDFMSILNDTAMEEFDKHFSFTRRKRTYDMYIRKYYSTSNFSKEDYNKKGVYNQDTVQYLQYVEYEYPKLTEEQIFYLLFKMKNYIFSWIINTMELKSQSLNKQNIHLIRSLVSTSMVEESVIMYIFLLSIHSNIHLQHLIHSQHYHAVQHSCPCCFSHPHMKLWSESLQVTQSYQQNINHCDGVFEGKDSFLQHLQTHKKNLLHTSLLAYLAVQYQMPTIPLLPSNIQSGISSIDDEYSNVIPSEQTICSDSFLFSVEIVSKKQKLKNCETSQIRKQIWYRSLNILNSSKASKILKIKLSHENYKSTIRHLEYINQKKIKPSKKRNNGSLTFGTTTGANRMVNFMRKDGSTGTLPHLLKNSRPGMPGNELESLPWFVDLINLVQFHTLKFLEEIRERDKSKYDKVMAYLKKLEKEVPPELRLCGSIFTQFNIVSSTLATKGSVKGHIDEKDIISIIIHLGNVLFGGETVYFRSNESEDVAKSIPFEHGRMQIGFFDEVFHGATEWEGNRITININLKLPVIKHFKEEGPKWYNQYIKDGRPWIQNYHAKLK